MVGEKLAREARGTAGADAGEKKDRLQGAGSCPGVQDCSSADPASWNYVGSKRRIIYSSVV